MGNRATIKAACNVSGGNDYDYLRVNGRVQLACVWQWDRPRAHTARGTPLYICSYDAFPCVRQRQRQIFTATSSQSSLPLPSCCIWMFLAIMLHVP